MIMRPASAAASKSMRSTMKSKSSSNEPASASGMSTSRSLLVRVRAEEPQAWERLFSIYRPLVAFWCRQLNVPPQDVDDVLQNVFRAVATNIDRFRRDRPGDTFRGWLRTITRSKAMDYHRSRADKPEAAGGTEANLRLHEVADLIDDESIDSAEEKPARDTVFHLALESIRAEFRPMTWQAFWRVVVDDKSPAEVAAELGMKPGAVRVAKCRVLHRLRAELGELPE